MATLYEMTDAARQLYEMFDNEEIDEQAINDTLESIGIEGKLEDYCKVIRQLEADGAMFKAEKARIADKQARAEKNVARMKEAILNYMQAVDKKEADAGLFKIKRRASEKVVVDDVFKINENYLKYSEPTVDKTAIKKAIKAGEQIEGCHIEVNDNINIK